MFFFLITLSTGQCTGSNWQGTHHLKNSSQLKMYKACALWAVAFRIISLTATLQSSSYSLIQGAKQTDSDNLAGGTTLLYLSEKNTSVHGGSCQGVPAISLSNSGNQGLVGHFEDMNRTLWFNCWILCNVVRMSEQGKVCLILEGWTGLESHAWLSTCCALAKRSCAWQKFS